MFERRTRQAFPTSMIVIFIILVLLLIAIRIYYKPAPANNSTGTNSHSPGFWPAEWFYAIREYPDFKTDVSRYTEALQYVRDEITVTNRNGYKGFNTAWTTEGPGNIGARINTIKVHPTNPNIIYIGYSAGGIWKSTDGGQNWFPVFDDQSFLSIGDIELDPQNPNIVYAGTGDPNISGYPFIGDGIWKSTDGGNSWQHMGLEQTRIISKITIDPVNPQIVYAATMGLPFERNNYRGLYKSIDGGQNWQQVLFISDEAGIIDMVMSPANSSVLYAAAWDRIRNNQESIVAGNNARIWKTIDGGQNWTMLEGGLPLDENSRIGLAIDPQNGNHIVATYAGNNLQFRALYETQNGGVEWTENQAGIDGSFQSDFAWYFGKVYLNPFNNQDIWLNGVYSLRSQNGGEAWDFGIDWSNDVHADHHDMAFIDANSLLLATDGGLYRSDDGGATWFKTENIPATQFYRVAANPFTPEWYYGGAQDNGTVTGNATDINGWFHVFGGDGFQAAFHPDNPNIYYFEWQNGNIVGTTDGGNFFNDATQGIAPSDRRHWDMQYLISRHDADIMYTGTYRVYMSYGHPPNWFSVSPDLTDGDIFGARFHTISTLDESPLDPDLLYVGTTDGNVWRGNPIQQDWTNISAGLPDRYVSAVKGSPSFPDRVYVAHTGYKSNDFQPLLHRSDNQGNSWTVISGDLPQLAVNDIVVLPGHQDSVIFVATDGGVYGTLNGGVHWERLGAGMPIVPVYDMELNTVQKTLFAGTHARSILSFPLDSLQLGADVSTQNPNALAAPELKMTPTLAQNSMDVSILNLPVKHKAEVWISSISGRFIWKGEFRGGQRGVETLDVSSWPPGVYIAFAQTQGKVWTQKKFVVAR